MTKTFICKTQEVPENGMRGFDLNGKRILILRSNNQVFASDGICPHQEVLLEEGLFDGKVLTCHSHLWQWNVCNGDAIGLAETPLDTYQVSVVDDSVYIEQRSILELCAIFSGLALDLLARIESAGQYVNFSAGEAIYDEGVLAKDIYILDTGRVEFIVDRGDRIIYSGYVHNRGEMFGWATLMESNATRLAKATCTEAARVLKIPGESLQQLFDEVPTAGLLVTRRLWIEAVRQLAGAKHGNQ